MLYIVLVINPNNPAAIIICDSGGLNNIRQLLHVEIFVLGQVTNTSLLTGMVGTFAEVSDQTLNNLRKGEKAIYV